MENVVVVALITSVVFTIFKFAEMKFIDKKKEARPLKYFIRDLCMVFVSAAAAGFVFFQTGGKIQEFLNTVTDAKVIIDGPAEVFTDAPGF
jgi:hypothetical protein